MRRSLNCFIRQSSYLKDKKQSNLQKNAFSLQRKSALKLINAGTSNKLNKTPGLDYSNNLSGNFTPIRLSDDDKDIWWLNFKPKDTSTGDFVYIPKFNQLGIALSIDIVDGRRVWHCLHSSGVVLPYPESAIAHSTPLFTQSELDHKSIQDIITHTKLNPPAQHHVYSPESDTNALYKAKLASRLKRLRYDLESVQRSLSHDFNELYAKIKHKNDLKWREYDIYTLATRDLKIKHPTHLHILALHMMLYSDTTEYNMLDNATSIHAMKFGVRPGTEVNILRLVHEWVNTRDGRATLEQFVNKSHKLLEASSHTSKAPTHPQALPLPVTYTPNEAILLRFITDSCQTLNTPSFNPYESLCCILLKNFPQYHHVSQENWRSLAFDFLQNVGVFAPWESIQMAGSMSIVPRDNHSDRQFDRVSESTSQEYKSGTGTSTTLQQRDPLDSHRRDFGQLPVFVIDDAGANELDDGISLEERDGKTWAHIHIADPTSVIPHTHPLSIIAKERITSIYLPHRTIPMLPKELCMEGFSLGSRSPQHALTFSAQIDEHGVITDYDISASVINNINIMQYDAVDRALGVEMSATRNDGTLLDLPSHPTDIQAIPPNHTATLKRMAHLATQQSTQRVKNGMLFWQSYSPSASVSPLPLPCTQTQTLWEGRPAVRLHAPPSTDSVSRFTVSQYMGIACQVAALWSMEHDTPGVFRSAPLPESSAEGGIDALLRQRDAVTGQVSSADVGRAAASFTGGTLSTRPVPHFLNGCVAGYARVTSPLRRYSDMVMHYQLRSALLAQHSPADRVGWMYRTHEEMEAYLGRCRQLEGAHQRISNRVNDYWVVRELKRRHEEGADYSGLTCTIVGGWKNDGSHTRSWADCEVGELGNMSARLVREYTAPHELALADIGRVVKASALDFQLYDRARLLVRLEEEL